MLFRSIPLIPGIPGVPVVGVSQTSNVVINPSPVASVTVGVCFLHHKVQFTYQVWLEPLISLPRKSHYERFAVLRICHNGLI